MKIIEIYRNTEVKAFLAPRLNEAIFGVELEIENVVNDPEFYCNALISYKEDGSLRNNGWEFVTRPLHYEDTINAINSVITDFPTEYHDIHFGERTSCHVHLNVGDMTCSQLATLLLAYQVVERLLFDFVGNDRDKSIFCVPLSECVTSYRAANQLADGNLTHVVDRWQKYTAFNLTRIPDLSTVEFRHLGGTGDIKKIEKWITMLKNMRDFAFFKTSYADLCLRINSLNTSSAYAAFTVDVIGNIDWWNYAKHAPMLEEGVLMAKYALVNPAHKPKAVVNPFPNQGVQRNILQFYNADVESAALVNVDGPPLGRGAELADIVRAQLVLRVPERLL